MRFYNSSFLCLDIGTYGVRGLAHCIKDAKIVRSATHSVKNKDTLFALKTVIDELEQNLNTHFDSAFITGNFGELDFQTFSNTITWKNEHKISDTDLNHQIAKIPIPENFYAMHIIPVFYETQNMKNISNSPIGHIATRLKSIFSVIFYLKDKTRHLANILHMAHIQPSRFFDPYFLQKAIYKPNNEKILFLDLGHEFTTFSVWTKRGPLFMNRIKSGQRDITEAISIGLHINYEDADILKISVSSAIQNEMDRFTPADSSEKFSKFSRADINNIFIQKLNELIKTVFEQSEKYKPTKIILTGGGAEINNINRFIEQIFNLPVENLGESATIKALSTYIWFLHLPECEEYIQKRKKTKNLLKNITKVFHKTNKQTSKKFVPILPSTLCFNMNDPAVYTMFKSANISIIHVDIMDGFYVNRVAGGISELLQIRQNTKSHLHVHLMTVNPSILSQEAIQAGADTVIVSLNTSGIMKAINIIKSAGKRCGIAINPDSSLKELTQYLQYIDEIMVMAVQPGASGQQFNESVLTKIKALNYTRKKHRLKYVISVDGGINPETAKWCWDAGANLLVSGSYLSNAADFPLAVQSLLKH